MDICSERVIELVSLTVGDGNPWNGKDIPFRRVKINRDGRSLGSWSNLGGFVDYPHVSNLLVIHPVVEPQHIRIRSHTVATIEIKCSGVGFINGQRMTYMGYYQIDSGTEITLGRGFIDLYGFRYEAPAFRIDFGLPGMYQSEY